jgi:hypothetical protein
MGKAAEAHSQDWLCQQIRRDYIGRWRDGKQIPRCAWDDNFIFSFYKLKQFREL